MGMNCGHFDSAKPCHCWRVECDVCKAWHSSGWHPYEDVVRSAVKDGWFICRITAAADAIVCHSCAKKYTLAELMQVGKTPKSKPSVERGVKMMPFRSFSVVSGAPV